MVRCSEVSRVNALGIDDIAPLTTAIWRNDEDHSITHILLIENHPVSAFHTLLCKYPQSENITHSRGSCIGNFMTFYH